MRHLSKTFGRLCVLDDVSLTVPRGTVLGIVGQNGSGKSTLVKLLSGVYAADPHGIVEAEGHVLSNPPSPAELRDRGLAFVHQDLGVINELTVAENVCVGRYAPRRRSRSIRREHERDAVAATLSTLQSSIDPDRLAGTLDAGERAVVAVARALHKLQPGHGCVVFDESTSSLPQELLPDFYALVRRLADRGTGVIVVSHHLGEVLTLADRVAVLRDGRLVAAGLDPRVTSEAALASLMLGRELADETRRPRRAAGGSPELRGVGLQVSGLVTARTDGLDFEVAPGEVLGLTGTPGSGHEEVPYAVAGALAAATGRVSVGTDSFALPVRDLGSLLRAGIALVPQQRAAEGLALEVSAQENLTLPRVAGRGRWLMRPGWQAAEFEQAADTLSIVPRRAHMPVAQFSGGNQQKILLAKWLLNRPRVLVLHEPTQAVDVGARLEILHAIRAAAADGVTVLVSSIVARDLALVCDRVLVLRSGAIGAELQADLTAAAIEAATYDAPVPVPERHDED